MDLALLDECLREYVKNQPKDFDYEKSGRQKSSSNLNSNNFGIMTKAALNESSSNMDQASLRSANRASSESSLIRLRRRDSKLQLNYFPSVENAVNHFRRKMDGPRVVTVSVPLNKRQNFLENGDEHKLKYHHRSIDELEKMSQNSERLRTVFDEEIDLDYIDIVYEANKPSKHHYMSLSCAPPLMPKNLSRTIKLQQRIDSRESSAKMSIHEESKAKNEEITLSNQTENSGMRINSTNPIETKDVISEAESQNISVHIHYKSSEPQTTQDRVLPTDQQNSKSPLQRENRSNSLIVPHRYSYFRKSNGFFGVVNRAGSRDFKKIFRYSKHINPHFKATHLS